MREREQTKLGRHMLKASTLKSDILRGVVALGACLREESSAGD